MVQKEQKTARTSTFSFLFIAIKTFMEAVETVQYFRFKCRIFRVPTNKVHIKNEIYNNEIMANNSIQLESLLSN